MRVYVDRNYGSDADGNRGITSIDYEIEDSDADVIAEKLFEKGYDGSEGSACVELYSDVIDDYIEVDVCPQDYKDLIETYMEEN